MVMAVVNFSRISSAARYLRMGQLAPFAARMRSQVAHSSAAAQLCLEARHPGLMTAEAKWSKRRCHRHARPCQQALTLAASAGLSYS